MADKLQNFGGLGKIRSIIIGKNSPAGANDVGIDEKTLKKLSRVEVLELLIEQIKENDDLRVNLRNMRKKLENRDIYLENAGSIAEAALHLNEVFEAADAAAKEYTESNRNVIDEKRKAVEERLAELNERLANIDQERLEILNAGQAEAREIVRQAEEESHRMLEETKEESQNIMQETLASCERKYEEVEEAYAKKKQEADEYWQSFLVKLDNFCAGYESLQRAARGEVEIPGLQKLKDELNTEVRRRTTDGQ